MADAMEMMLARLRRLKANPPVAQLLEPALQSASTAATRSALLRRTPVRGRVRITSGTATLSFTGPGAAHADLVARKRLQTAVPEAVETARREVSRRLEGR